jgi:uncharacterized protein DUF6599
MRNYRISVLFSLAPAFLGAAAVIAAPTASLFAQMPTSIARPPKPATKPATKSDVKPAANTPEKPVSKSDAPLLPTSFSGWDSATATQSAAKPVTDPMQTDPSSAAALKEYGFTDAVFRDYTREGETLKVKALRFADASGAYGAYSFYRKSGWPKEDVGTGAASDHNRVLFWIGNVVVDSQFSRISAMSGSELRELAATIPVPAGNKSLSPPILASLPQKEIDGQTTHYAVGPAGYAGSGGVLPPELVGFDRGAETATATYSLRSGPATLTIIDYPTPQMAAAEEKGIATYLKAGNTPQHPFTKPLQDSNPAAIEVRRVGPLVAVVSGDAITDEAHKLLLSVHYEADMSPVPGEPNTEIRKTAQLLVAIITLVIVMFVAAVLLALFLGGGRALYRYLRGKPISSVYDEEFIRIDLSE